MGTQQDGRSGFHGRLRYRAIDVDQAAHPCFGRPPQDRALENTACVRAEVLARKPAPLRFREFRHAQAQVRQGDVAALAKYQEQQAADGLAETPKDGQGQPMQQPEESNQDPHATASACGAATPSGCL
jgi:hypothetical protein